MGGDCGRGTDEAIEMRDPYSRNSLYLKGSIQALDPQSVHVGVGNVIDQLHLDSVIPRSDLYVVPILVIVHAPYGPLFFIIRVTVRVVTRPI